MEPRYATDHPSQHRPVELLKTETDPTKRIMEKRLLAEEEAKLKRSAQVEEKKAY